ncbi:hypothetical protein [Paenibacillus spongiae]|uniref:Bacterial CdiA-CT RNAse A domain-containing protein n=1 Tax=Paenibacillus spongiae TaxID=2909671 RepID=A0ABY5SHK2_9BACL|nr:hypothetical protein [Paenibacillus spongiae]UVI32945.1 hypothetical protein L1F29_14390 [Paenibacillus spongiae]
MGEKHVRITTESTFNDSRIPQRTVDALIKKVNEATNLAAYSQIRAHFKPYFTDAFINKIIQDKGLYVNVPFTDVAYIHSDEKKGTVTQYGSPKDIAANSVERMITVKYIQDKWMVDTIIFTHLTP